MVCECATFEGGSGAAGSFMGFSAMQNLIANAGVLYLFWGRGLWVWGLVFGDAGLGFRI